MFLCFFFFKQPFSSFSHFASNRESYCSLCAATPVQDIYILPVSTSCSKVQWAASLDTTTFDTAKVNCTCSRYSILHTMSLSGSMYRLYTVLLLSTVHRLVFVYIETPFPCTCNYTFSLPPARVGVTSSTQQEQGSRLLQDLLLALVHHMTVKSHHSQPSTLARTQPVEGQAATSLAK